MSPKSFISASKFQSKCAGIIDAVHKTGRSIVVTKRGTPVVMIVPYEAAEKPKKRVFGILKDTITINGDIISH